MWDAKLKASKKENTQINTFTHPSREIKIDEFQICDKVNTGMTLVLSIIKNNVNGATVKQTRSCHLGGSTSSSSTP